MGSSTLSSPADTHQIEPVYSSQLIVVLGIIPIVGSGALAARLIWEQTVWSWERGPQIVGFSLVHGAGAILLLFPILLACWLVVSAIYLGWRLLKRRRLPRAFLVAMGLAIILFGTLALPYGFWQRLFIAKLASGPHAARFLTFAAATGDLATVKAFVAHGLPVDVRDPQGRTGLQTATASGQTRVVEYLLSAGADGANIVRGTEK